MTILLSKIKIDMKTEKHIAVNGDQLGAHSKKWNDISRAMGWR